MKAAHFLVSVLCFLFISGLEAADAKAPKKYKNVGVEEFDKLRQDKKNVVLDVRTPEEYAEGHIAGATNIDINADDFQQKISKLDKDKTYLVHCAAGGRSARACNQLGKLNFTKLYNLEGGMGAWEKAGKPVEKK
ncbi:MAG TPA: rhodanese-like domain-containing protein [Candidatus Saccharimonadales bacterium]|nr:rhodanese-like domain-containing protein [Candidatus Saccharimonadales bacterium]